MGRGGTERWTKIVLFLTTDRIVRVEELARQVASFSLGESEMWGKKPCGVPDQTHRVGTKAPL